MRHVSLTFDASVIVIQVADCEQSLTFQIGGVSIVVDSAGILPLEHGRRKYKPSCPVASSVSTSLSNMVEEKEYPAQFYIKNKETGLNDSNDDGVLLKDDKRASAERLLVKKLDQRLLPTIVVIYIMNFIDVRQPHWVF